MPNLSEDQIKKAIADNHILALSLDTAVFKAKQYDFKNQSLRGLNQFLGTDISVILSEVVVREMKRHVAEEVTETQRAAKKALRSHIWRWNIQDTDKIYDQLSISASPDDEANLQVDQFMLADGIESVAVPKSDAFALNVLDRYFSSTAPFAKSDKKKHEFPDAYALLSLEVWAIENKKMVLCVSPDKGWQAFCDASDSLVCVADLDSALSYFNESFQDIADAIVGIWREGKPGEYLDIISHAFEYRLEDLNFHVEAEADTLFEAEVTEATLQYVDPTTVSDPVVIASAEDSITFRVSVNAVVSFRAAFDFYVIDSVDKDTVNLGAEEAYAEEMLPFELTVTADRDVKGLPVFHEVSVSRKSLDVEFGYVEAFPNENPEDPYY